MTTKLEAMKEKEEAQWDNIEYELALILKMFALNCDRETIINKLANCLALAEQI